jgi:hypothetical protein
MRLLGAAWWRRLRAAGVVALVIVLAASSVATAAPIPPMLSDPAAQEADLAAIARVLESRLVVAHLRTLGLAPQAIEARLARLDDGELRRMAQALPEVAVGGQEQRELSGEQKAGVALLILVALAVFGGLLYLSLAGF